MERKDKNPTQRSQEENSLKRVQAAFAKRDLNSIIEKNDYQKGQLFYSRDKATYTFLNENEVVSLHFDLSRRTLFLRGHKITSWEDHPRLVEFLTKFKKALTDAEAPSLFITEFDNVASKLAKL